MKILHTADMHLGREFPTLREKGKVYRKQLLATFEKIVKLAMDEDVALVLIVGDLFDTNRSHGIVIGKVLSEFEKLEKRGIRICILPGTHDAYTEESIYRFVCFPSNVIIFTPTHDHEYFDDLDLTVYGKAFDGRLVGESPLKGLSLVKDSKFHVGMAHCSIKIKGVIEKDSMILDKKEIANSKLDYLALGHWHSFQEYSQGNTIAYYCGSPEPTYMDQKESGRVAMVDIYEKGKVEVTPVCVGNKEFDEITIDIERIKSIKDIIMKIETKANPDLILKVTLKGSCSIYHDLNYKEIQEELSDKFFSLQVLDKTHPKLKEIKPKDFPEEIVIGRFIKNMKEKIKEAKKEDKALYKEALKLGFALLQGRTEGIE